MREKDPNKLEAIYAATLKMVLADGFTALKMSNVAKEAGVATGTLYVYFSGKDELINQLYMTLKKENAQHVLEGYNAHAPFMVNFDRIWKNYLFTQLKRPEAAAFLEQYYRSPYLRAHVKEETDKLLEPIFELLERGKKERLLKDIPTQLLVMQLSGAISEFVRWYASGLWAVNEEAIEHAFKMAWDSIKQ